MWLLISPDVLIIAACNELPPPEDGSVTCDYGNDGIPSYQDVCWYTCEDGFQLFGSSSRTCLNTSVWSNDEPVCTRGLFITCRLKYALVFYISVLFLLASCPSLNHPSNGVISCLIRINQDAMNEITCNYACDMGYQLTNGSQSRTCLTDGMWNGAEGTCQRG